MEMPNKNNINMLGVNIGYISAPLAEYNQIENPLDFNFAYHGTNGVIEKLLLWIKFDYCTCHVLCVLCVSGGSAENMEYSSAHPLARFA